MPIAPPSSPLSYPQVKDANGAMIDLQGIQKVRAYMMDSVAANSIVALPTDGTAFATPRAILADKAGTATVVDIAGNTITGFPLTGQNQTLPVTKISSLATTTKVWGIY